MSTRSRLAPIDWLRGLVMVVMTLDHASAAFNRGRLFTDSVWLAKAGQVLDPAQFLLRWVTHLCAPTFVFLAGTAIALMAAGRVARGESEGSVDRQLLLRGAVILALDPLWMTLGLTGSYERIILQVLYAIGASMILLAPLRRLPPAALAALGLALIAGTDLLLSPLLSAAQATPGGAGAPPLLAWLLVAGGPRGAVVVGYPVASWLGMMLLGCAFGARLLRRPDEPPIRGLLLSGLGALALFALVRGLNGAGNMALLREDGSWVQWLHVSKYPPSISYAALELGLMALSLAAFFHLGRKGDLPALRPLRLFGSTAMFFYLLHAHLLTLAAHLLGVEHQLGIGATLAASAICVAALYLPCSWYASYKASHSNWLVRLV